MRRVVVVVVCRGCVVGALWWWWDGRGVVMGWVVQLNELNMGSDLVMRLVT